MDQTYWVLQMKVDSWTAEDYKFFVYWLGLCPKNIITFRRALAQVLSTEAFHILHDNSECVPIHALMQNGLTIIIPTNTRPVSMNSGRYAFRLGDTSLRFNEIDFTIDPADCDMSFRSCNIKEYGDYRQVMTAYGANIVNINNENVLRGTKRTLDMMLAL